MKKITLQLLILFLLSTAFCQTAQITNVDTTYFSPKWQSDNLTTNKFRNGDEIIVCQNANEWKSLCSKVNQSLVFISKDLEYYYNFYAITDKRKLCPNGYKIPKIKDFTTSKLVNIESPMSNQNAFDLNFKTTGLLDYSGGTVQIDNKSKKSTYLVTSNLGEIETDNYYSSAHIYNLSNDWFAEEWPVSKNSGLSVRCISDIDEIIQDSIFDYKKLIPNEYKELLLSLFSEVKKAESTSKEFIYKIKGELNCDKDGNVSGYFNSEDIVFGKMKVNSIIPKMNQIIKEFNTVPYYHGNILKARSELSLVFKLERIDLEKETFYLSFSKTQKLKGNYELNYASEYSFKIKQYEEKVKIEDGGNVAILQSTNYIESFKGRGPIYAIGSILPGLGMSLITYGNSNSKVRTNFKKFLLISSITAGTAAVVSKLYSNQYYNRYLNYLNSDLSAENYKKANALQKVFLSAGIGYCLLGAIDFTWTFTIGCKNKSIQNKLNKQIKGSPTNFILQ